MACLLQDLGNENEIRVYLAKCNLGMRIKYASLTQIGNKEYESHSYEGLGMRILINELTFVSF